MVITQPRRLELQTAIDSGLTVHIAAPRSEHGQQVAQVIAQALQQQGAQTEIHADPEEDLLRSAQGPVIVVGNLADSRCVRGLYYRSRCATDLCYPGPGGYELRTLCDHFGTGHNLILIGYSDADGAAAAGDVFKKRLGHTIPHLKELHVTRLPLPAPNAEAYRRGDLPATAAEIANTMEGDNIGYLYYLTGEPELGVIYRKVWQAFLSCGYEKNHDIVQAHLFSLWRLLPWRLVEDMDLFDEAERLAITQFIYGWAESGEGWQNVAHCPRTQRPNNARQNHELIPAMALMHAADYFEAHYPTAPGPDHWRTVGRTAFEPYGTSWKPLCDGLCHGWWMSLPVIMEFALLDPEHRYFAEGGARKAAECAMAVVNNDGWMPCAGDTDLKRQFPGPVLRIAADFYQDGSFKFVHDLAPPDRRFGWQPLLPRAFDSGVAAEKPKTHIGVTVVPVDPLVYHVWEHEPEIAVDAVATPPSAPIEQCFDKLAVRTGWNLADDYLLIDGLGGGSHSYDDAGGIVEYARLGVSVVVQEDSFVHSAPEHHSVVTIVRDGQSGIIPGFSILEEQHTDDAGTVYLRLRSKDYAGADWVREIHLFPGKCAAFVDTVTANTTGDFAVEAHFRTPTRLTLDNHGARGKRKSPCTGEVEVRLTSLSDASHLSITDIPFHYRYPAEVDQELWRTRYRSAEMVLTAFAARDTTLLKPGESVRLVHVAQACAPDETPVHLLQEGAELFITEGETRTPLKTFAIKLPTASQSEKATSTDAKGLNPFFNAGAPITALCQLNAGAIAVGTNSGALSYVGDDGQAKWSTNIEGPIHDIGVTATDQSTLIAAGHGLADLTTFNAMGDQQWSHHIGREPSPWPWWELTSPIPVQVAGGVIDGEEFFAVGCGDLQLRCFDPKGKELWSTRHYGGVPGRVTVADVDGSGKQRIIEGGEILSCTSACCLFEPNGTLIVNLPVEGWTSMLTALALGDAGERHFIGCGANRGKNLHMFELHDGKWQSNWLTQLGGQVNGICIFGAEDCMIVATSQGFLIGYDLTGKQLWHLLFTQGLRHLVRFGNRVIAVDAAGGLLIVNLTGQVEHQTALPGPCSFVTHDSHGIFFACGHEIWRYDPA